MTQTRTIRTLAAATALACLSLPNVGVAAAKPQSNEIDKVASKATLAQALRRIDRSQGFKKHSVATYERLKFVDAATSIKGIAFRNPVKLGSNKAIAAKYREHFSKADLACLAKLKVQLKDATGRASAHKCGKDRLVLFVPQAPATPPGKPQTNAFGVDDAIVAGIFIIAGGGIWASFQETEFHGGELETAILCSNAANANMAECLSKDTSGGDDNPGGSDPNDDSDDDDDDDNESGTDPGNTNGGIN